MQQADRIHRVSGSNITALNPVGGIAAFFNRMAESLPQQRGQITAKMKMKN